MRRCFHFLIIVWINRPPRYGKKKEMKCYQYSERDIVRKAWEVHGGPIGLWHKQVLSSIK